MEYLRTHQTHVFKLIIYQVLCTPLPLPFHLQNGLKKLAKTGTLISIIYIYGKLNDFHLQWRHNGRDVVSNHQPHDCLLNRLSRRRSKKTSKLRVTDLWTVNSSVTGEFPAHRASNVENVSIWWRHHVLSDKREMSWNLLIRIDM